MFVLASNHFQKCFSVNFPEMLFSWSCVLVGLTRKWFEVKIFTSNYFQTHAQRERERSHPDHATNLEPRALWLRTLRLRLRIAPRLHPSTSSANPEPRAQSPWTLTSNRTQITPFNFAGEPRAQITPSTSPRSHRDSTDRTKIAIEKWLGFDEFDRI